MCGSGEGYPGPHMPEATGLSFTWDSICTPEATSLSYGRQAWMYMYI